MAPPFLDTNIFLHYRPFEQGQRALWVDLGLWALAPWATSWYPIPL